MSRLLSLLTLAALLPAASAQGVLSDSTTLYVIPHVGYTFAYGVGQSSLVGAVVGRRVSERVDVGFRIDVGDASEAGRALFLAAGPQVGRTANVAGLDASVRLGALAVFGQRVAPTDASGFQSAGVQTEVTFARSFTSGPRLRIAPTGGLFGAACVTRNEATAPGASCAEMGVLTGFELGFRAFGADVSIPVMARHRIAGNQRQANRAPLDVLSAPISGGVRLRF